MPDRPVLLEVLDKKEGSAKHGLFRCECGNTFTARISAVNYGNTRSCGCWRKLVAAERARSFNQFNIKHGWAKRNTRLPEYICWANMNSRCHRKTHPSYSAYGGRGITVCPQWRHDFGKFLEDVGRKPHPKLSLDRINNNGIYEPGNVRWVTQKIQCNNTRSSKCIQGGGRDA